MSKRNYYRVEEGSETHKIISKFCTEATRIRTSWRDFMVEAGGIEAYANRRLLGITMENPDLSLWHNPKNLPKGCYKPRRIKDNSWYKKFSKLETDPSAFELAEALNIQPIFTGNSIAFPAIEWIKDVLILSLSEGTSPPTGAQALKTSDYYKLKGE